MHSLTGIIPIGAFLIEHFFSNFVAIEGPAAYTKQVAFLAGFPFVFFLELFGIWIPILYHALYGFYIWYRGEVNVRDYPWTGNWLYTTQRWTGAIAFFYMIYHTYHLRFREPPPSGGALVVARSNPGLFLRRNCWSEICILDWLF